MCGLRLVHWVTQIEKINDVKDVKSFYTSNDAEYWEIVAFN